MLASVVGVSGLISESEIAFATILYAGAGYLLYLAVQTLRHPPGVEMDAMAMPARSLIWTYFDATVVNLLNPKVALFFVAFLPQFLAPTDEAGPIHIQLLVLGLVFFAIALLLEISYALLGGRRTMAAAKMRPTHLDAMACLRDLHGTGHLRSVDLNSPLAP